MIRKFHYFLAVLLVFLLPLTLNAQEKYWVVFKDKEEVKFDPFLYFDDHTLEKRKRNGIPLVQFSDLPVKTEYIERVGEYGNISTVSRWLNAVSINTSESELQALQDLEFVSSVEPIQSKLSIAGKVELDVNPKYMDILKNQVESMGGDLFIKEGIDGKGIRIAVFDIGFTNVDSLEIFRHLHKSGRIIATYDFVDDDKDVYHYNTHGTTVLACIAGMLDSLQFGLGTGAEFLLARTEQKNEVFAEEEYWAAAMEWADKNGADIISSSLGYTHKRYFPKDMDGQSVFVSRVAKMAARKGILVINAAGNDGDGDWEVINAPGDADSVLTVGGISPHSGIHISFSSFGPTADGRLKPNVSSFGEVISIGKSSIKKSYGTSFSTPLISGFAACVMQMNPDWNNMEVFNEIQKSGHLYPYYDYAHGYGVPQASYFFNSSDDPPESFKFSQSVDALEILILIENISINAYEPHASANRYTMDDQYLYYHIADSETGNIRKYAVVRMTEANKFQIPLNKIRKGETVKALYQGYSAEFKANR